MNTKPDSRMFLWRATKKLLRFGTQPIRTIRYQTVGSQSACEIGSSKWLIAAEKQYGGIQRNVPRNRVSEVDPRSAIEIRRGGMTGGDRMFFHGYATAYSHWLTPFVERRDKSYCIVEVGILRGTGLAIWCDLFPNARVIGLDIDLAHAQENMDNMIQQGAFRNSSPELHDFDQLQDDENRIEQILNGEKVDICIDDGLHTEAAILNTLKTMKPFLADRFIYLIEDNADALPLLRNEHADLAFQRAKLPFYSSGGLIACERALG